MSYKTIEGGVTAPKGFRAAAKYCAIKVKKEPNPKPDVTVVVSDCEASCAAVFTTNKFCAAPVILGREVLKREKPAPSSSTAATPTPPPASRASPTPRRWKPSWKSCWAWARTRSLSPPPA